MTPAIHLLKKKKIPYTIHQYSHDTRVTAYGLEAVEKLGISSERIFKTLVVSLDANSLATAVIPVPEKLSMKLMAHATSAKKAARAEPIDVERVTGYVLGGVSPVGQKKQLPTFLDYSARNFDTIIISAGRRGIDIEIAPTDLLNLTKARYLPLCQ